MIFVTVGTQLPFPRLIRAMDALVPTLGEEILAQIGPEPVEVSHLDVLPQLTPAEFEAKFKAARVVVAHAGIGTILSAKRFGKPLILLPRKADLGEHRNDHQLATARQVETLPGVYIAWETEALGALLGQENLIPANQDMSETHKALVDRLKSFVAA